MTFRSSILAALRGHPEPKLTPAMAADPVTKDWWKICSPLQEPFETRRDGEWWAMMQPVFHTD